MINKREIQTVQKSYELVSITCDICGKTYTQENNISDIEEFHYIHFTGGYGSKFGDGSNVRCDICDACLHELLKDKWYEIDENGNIIKEQ